MRPIDFFLIIFSLTKRTHPSPFNLSFINTTYSSGSNFQLKHPCQYKLFIYLIFGTKPKVECDETDLHFILKPFIHYNYSISTRTHPLPFSPTNIIIAHTHRGPTKTPMAYKFLNMYIFFFSFLLQKYRFMK